MLYDENSYLAICYHRNIKGEYKICSQSPWSHLKVQDDPLTSLNEALAVADEWAYNKKEKPRKTWKVGIITEYGELLTQEQCLLIIAQLENHVAGVKL